jgi:hypothetical protein
MLEIEPNNLGKIMLKDLEKAYKDYDSSLFILESKVKGCKWE